MAIGYRPSRLRLCRSKKSYYLHCKPGGRSLQALQFLREQGFKNLKSVKGGITAWSDAIDNAVPKY